MSNSRFRAVLQLFFFRVYIFSFFHFFGSFAVFVQVLAFFFVVVAAVVILLIIVVGRSRRSEEAPKKRPLPNGPPFSFSRTGHENPRVMVSPFNTW